MEGVVNGAVTLAPGAEDKGAPPPPSPLTGCYLLLVIAEPYTPQHKDIILQRIAKGLLSWNVNECLVDLEKELAIVTEQALEGEEARYGERLIQFASENLVTEILIHPVVSTLAQCMRNLLSSFTKHRHIIHAGYTFAANGSWALQDGTFSYTDFAEAFQELEVQRVIRAYENGITIDLHCSPEGDWNKLPKEQFTKACKVRVNPSDVLTSGSPAINNFTNYISPFMIPTSLESLLESSDVVGNIRFSRPTLYVFPGGQGDAALFGINGFNMLLDGGYARKACFWDFVRHLDRLDAVLMTRLNNSNVGGISSVLRRKKQDALYPQIGHFFCNLQERKALLSPDGDKDRDPLLINLLDEGQEIVSNLRHLHLTPQVCYRDSEPINLYHKVGHGTLDMYILSPSKDSKEVREFLHKWNQSDLKLFANAKSSREFSFPLQNLVSIAALLVWQPADPDDTITRILFPGSCPQAKLFEGLDRLKSLEFVKSAVCTEKSLSSTTSIKKTAIIERIATKEKEKIIITDKKENKIIENNIADVNVEIKEKTSVKKSDSTESDRSIKQKKIEDHKIENGDRSKPKPRPAKPRSDSQQRRKPIEKKASPKKVPTENGDARKPTKPSPVATPAKSAKDASNRRVIESKVKQATAPKPSATDPKPKVERKPISRRPKAMKAAPISPIKKLVNGVQKPDSISKKGRLDKEGTTDSSTVSTPSVDQESVLKKDISKLTPEELQQLKAQELADLKEEQEAVKEIEAVFRKGEGVKHIIADDENVRKVKDVSIDEEKIEEKEEYLIIEKEVIQQQDSLDDKEPKEDETQKLARDSEESEKQRKSSVDEQRVEIESQVNGIVTEAEDMIKSKEEHVASLDDKGDSGAEKKVTDKDIDEVKDVVESQPDEKVSVNIKSGDTTTAPTLPEDERIPLDEIKEDNGQMIEEKHVKEDTKEKELPVIQLPPKPAAETVGKIPSVVGIRLDKQSHIRDIVKTPDEVADLPVHEEADFEYTQDVKAEIAKTNEILEDKRSEEKVKSKEESKMVESEKDSDELAQEKPKEVVPKMTEELKHLTDTVIKTELKTDTLEDKLLEDEKSEDQRPKKEESDLKKSEMDFKDIEAKIDIVEKQEKEEQEFKKDPIKEKSPVTTLITVSKNDIAKDKTIDVEKESTTNDEQKDEIVELSGELKTESKDHTRPKEDEQTDDQEERHLEIEPQKKEIPEKLELQKSETRQTQGAVETDKPDAEIGKLDKEKSESDTHKEIQQNDKDFQSKSEPSQEPLKSPTLHGEVKHTPHEQRLDKAESNKRMDDSESKDETVVKDDISGETKEAKKIYDPVRAKEEIIESKIELELKESKETSSHLADKVKTDEKDSVVGHEKTATEKVDECSMLMDSEKIDIAEQGTKDITQDETLEEEHLKADVTKTAVADPSHDKVPELEKDVCETAQEIKDYEVDAGPVKELMKDEKEGKIESKIEESRKDTEHDNKPDKKLHEDEQYKEIKSDEKEEKDIATPIKAKEGKTGLDKEDNVKNEYKHTLEKREVEEDTRIFEKPADIALSKHIHPEQKQPTVAEKQLHTDISKDMHSETESIEVEKETVKHASELNTEQKRFPGEKMQNGIDATKDSQLEDVKSTSEHADLRREHDTPTAAPKDSHIDNKIYLGQHMEHGQSVHGDEQKDTHVTEEHKKSISEIEEHAKKYVDEEKQTEIDLSKDQHMHYVTSIVENKQKDTDITGERKKSISEAEKDDKKPVGEKKQKGTDVAKDQHMHHETSIAEDKQKDTDITGERKKSISEAEKDDKRPVGEEKQKETDVAKDKHMHHETSIVEDKQKDTDITGERKKSISEAEKDDKKPVGEEKQKGTDVAKDQHMHHETSIVEDKQKDTDITGERKKSISEAEKDDKRPVGEEKQKETDVAKDEHMHHETSIVEDKQKDTDITGERKKSISEAEKDDKKPVGEEKQKGTDVAKDQHMHHETSIVEDKQKDTDITGERKKSISEAEKDDKKPVGEEKQKGTDVAKDQHMHHETSIVEDKQKDTDITGERKKSISEAEKDDKRPVGEEKQKETDVAKDEHMHHETSIVEDKQKDTDITGERKKSISEAEKDDKKPVGEEKQKGTDVAKDQHMHHETSIVEDKQKDTDITGERKKSISEAEKDDKKPVGEEKQKGTDVAKDQHMHHETSIVEDKQKDTDITGERKKSISEAEKDDKKPVGEEKQKGTDVAKDQHMHHETSIVEDKQKDTDITGERKKSISEAEKDDKRPVGEEKQKETDVAKDEHMHHETSIVEDKQKNTDITGERKKSISEAEKDDKKPVGEEKQKGTDVAKDQHMHHETSIVEDKQKDTDITGERKKSISEAEKDDKKPVGEEKQKGTNVAKDQHMHHETSIVEDKQKDTDITGERKKSISEEEKADKKSVGEEKQKEIDVAKDQHMQHKESIVEDMQKDTIITRKHKKSISEIEVQDKKYAGEEKHKVIDLSKDQHMEHDKSIVEDKQDDGDITEELERSISELERIELGRKSPMDLGRKSPKEREEDVIKIVASVAEVLKSDAPLEEFEGKLPIDTFPPFTSELRETHITTLDSPSATNGEIVKSDITDSFIREEEKHEIEASDRRSSLLKESQDLMMATSKMISDIKTAKSDEKEDDEEVGTVHRMLVTASSEDGGEETEICPPGSITFSRSSESSGRSSPEHSQKLSSQKSSIIDTVSESLTTVIPPREQEEKDSGIDEVKSNMELPDPKSAISTTEKGSGRESPAIKKAEDVISGKSTPDKDASIKSIASGKSTPDISDLEQSKDTDEFRKTEEEISIETVEKIEAEAAVAKKHMVDESKKIDQKVGYGQTEMKKEKDEKEVQNEEKEFQYIRDASPKDLDYDASKVENDKTPERSPHKVSDNLKKEIDELQDSFIQAVSKEDETPMKSSIVENDKIKSKIDLDQDQDEKLPRKSSLKANDLLKKEIQEVQENFIDSVAKDAAMVDGIDIDETSPRKMSPTNGKPLQDEIQEVQDYVSKDSKAIDEKQYTFDKIKESFVEESKPDLQSKPMFKQTDEFLRKEIEAVQEDFIQSLPENKKSEESYDRDVGKLALKADELLKEEIIQLQEGLVDALAVDKVEEEIHDVVESKMAVNDKGAKDVEYIHDKIDAQKQPSLKGDSEEGIQKTSVKEAVVEKIHVAPQKFEQLLKEEIDEVQKEFIDSVSKDFETGTMVKQEIKDTLLKQQSMPKSEQKEYVSQDTTEEQIEREGKVSYHMLPKAEFPEKIVDPTKSPRELLKEEIKELQDSFVESIQKDIVSEAKTVIESFEKIDEKLSLKSNEMKDDGRSSQHDLEKDGEHVQGQLKKDTGEVHDVTDAVPKAVIGDEHQEPLKKSSKNDEMIKEEIKELQQTFIEAVASDIKTNEIIVGPSELKSDKLLHQVNGTVEKEISTKHSLKEDGSLEKEIMKVQEDFIESASIDVSSKEEQTKRDKSDVKSTTMHDDMPKEDVSVFQTDKKESAEYKLKDKDLLRKDSMKADELLKKDIVEMQDTFIESVAEGAETVQQFDSLGKTKLSLKADELLKEEIKEVQDSFIDAVATSSGTETENICLQEKPEKISHLDSKPPLKEDENKDTMLLEKSADRKSSLTSNRLIEDTKGHVKDETKDKQTESERKQIIEADEETKKAIQEIQDEFIESVAEDFVLIDRIPKDNTADQTNIEADELDKGKSPPVKEKSEKILEESANEIVETFDQVADMTKSIIFDRCETSVIDPGVVEKDEEELEKRAEDIEEAYEAVNALAKSISFEKLTDKKNEACKESVTIDMSKSVIIDESDSSKIEQAISQRDEKLLERQAHDIENAYDTVQKLEKSISSDKIEEKAKMDEATLKRDEKLLEQKANDIEDAYDTVSKLAKSISFEKVEDTLHVDQETLKKEERLLEQRADDIEDAYDTVTKLSENIPFKKVDSTFHIDQAVIEHDEKMLEQTAGDVEKAYETVTKLAKRISFDKVEDKGEKGKNSDDGLKHTTMQDHEFNGQSQKSQDSRQTIVASQDTEKHVADEKTVEKERKDSISQPGKESLLSSDHDHENIYANKTTLEVEQPSSGAKKLSISEVEISLTGDKSSDDKQLLVEETYLYEKHISGDATPPTVPVSPNIKESSETSYVEYTESSVHLMATTEQMDPMCMSFYGSLPGEEKGDEESINEGEVTHLFEITKAKFSTPMPDVADSGKRQPQQTGAEQPSSSTEDKDSAAKNLGKPLGLPPPPQPTYLYEITKAKYSTGTETEEEEELVEEKVQGSYVYRETDMMNTSFYGSLPTDTEEDFDPLRMWGKPLGLPSPAPPNDNKGTPKKERKLPSNVSAKNKLNDDKKRAESPSKHNRNRKNNPIYVDLTYVPHHGNTYYAYVDFFKRIRARYYVFSGIEPSREVYNALLEAKQTWEDKELEVTIIPTYDTDVLGYWVAENEDLLAKFKIDLSPSASRCTINLQDHETSCSAYRLEF